MLYDIIKVEKFNASIPKDIPSLTFDNETVFEDKG